MEIKLMPKDFEEYAEARRNGFMKAKKIKEDGGKIAGIFCAFTPLEIIEASGAMPVSLCGSSEEPIIEAEAHLPKNICPMVKSSYGFAITDKCPYTYFSDIIIGETTCDAKKKMFELMGKMKNLHVMQLPQSVERESSWSMWAEEVELLRKRLENEFDIEITDQMLREKVKDRNEYRKLHLEFLELGKLVPPPLKGIDMGTVLDGLNYEFDMEGKCEKLRSLIDNTVESYNQGLRPVSPDAKRILITGCPMGGVIEKTVGFIDEEGGVVVCFENCGGVKNAGKLIDPDSQDIVKAIADRYLSIGCSVISPNTNRMNHIEELIEEYRIDGVVEIILQACHTYNIESEITKSISNSLGVPHIRIETDYSSSDEGQLRTRLAAFIEML